MTEIESKFIRQLKIKDYIYIATLLIGALLWWRDDVKEDAVVEANMINLVGEVEDINDKLDRHEKYWINQNEINGRVITYIDIDSR